jgi:FMN phosphatase YigB (HAD superfamily)
LLLELEVNPTTDLVNDLVDIILGSLPTQIAYDDTVETLGKLRRNYRLILLSNTFQEGFTNLQTNYPINNWFELACLSYKENMIKPNSALYDMIFEQSGLYKDEILMIGDNYHDDVLAANQVGIQAILLDRRNRYPEVLDNKINDLHELVALLELE